jgi:hypothetical protein
VGKQRIEWSVPSNAQIGDLIVMYHAGKDAKRRPASEIRSLWRVVGPFKKYGKRNKRDRKPGLQAWLRRVVHLHKPVTFAELKRDRATRDMKVVIRRFIGTNDLTLANDWPRLYDKIVDFNPRAKAALRPYRPD